MKPPIDIELINLETHCIHDELEALTEEVPHVDVAAIVVVALLPGGKMNIYSSNLALESVRPVLAMAADEVAHESATIKKLSADEDEALERQKPQKAH